MILKYCFKDEIHKSFIAPPTFISLLKEVTTIFGDKLPSNFTLQYRDNDGDFVTISSDIEYLSMLKFDLPKVREMVRIFIIPSHQSQMMDEADVKPVDLSLSSKKSSDGSFEVIEENSQNTSGNISEFSLDSAKKSSSSKSHSEASSSPKVAVQDFNFNEENSSDSSVDFDESIHSHNDTIHKIEARVQAHRTPVSMRQNNAGDLMDDDDEDTDEKTLPMTQNNAGDLVDDEDSLEEGDQEMRRIEQLQTSIDRILNFIQPADTNCYGNNGKASPTQYYSLDNSVLSKEINQAAEELAAIRIRRIINRLKNLQPPSDKEDSSPSFNESEHSEEEESIDLRDIKPLTYTEMGLERRARIMSVVSAAIVIQKAYRSYRINKLIKVFRDFEASYPLITEHSLSRKDQGTQMIPLEYQYEFSASRTISEASSFDIKTPCEPKEEPESWNLQKIQPKDYRVSFEENSYEDNKGESPMKKCYHCADFEFCEHYHSGYKTFNDSHMRMMAQNYQFKAPSKFNYIPSPILKGRYDSYFMSNQVAEPVMREADKSLNYRLLPGMSNTPVFLSSIDGKKIAYKTVYLINTGSRPWRKCYVKAMGPLSGRTAEIYNIDVGQIALATIELYGHYGADSYKSQWKVIHENENGMMEPVGEPFEVDITFEVKENMIDEEIMREIREQGDEGRQEQEEEEAQEMQEMQENKSMSLSMEERRLDEFRAKYIYQNSQDYEDQDQDYYPDSMGLSVEQRNVHQTEEDDEEEYEEDYEDEEEEEDNEEDDDNEEDYEDEEEEEDEEEQPAIDEENMPFANYQKYLEEIAKVKEIGRHFPCDPWDEIFDFVLERAYMSIEQIYEEYVSYRNAV